MKKKKRQLIAFLNLISNMDYKSKYEELKDQVIDNFDYWLDEEITTDMAEEKEVYTMITEYDEYLF